MGTIRFVTSIAALIAMVGCAGLRYPGSIDDSKPGGIRYYETSWYLLAYSDEAGRLVTQWLSLPDQTRLRTVEPFNFVSKLESTLEFNNGVLMSSSESGDSTQVPKALLTAAETLAGTLGPLLNAPGGEVQVPDFYTVPAPHVYKAVADGGVVHFYGGPGDYDFHVTISPKGVVSEKKADDTAKGETKAEDTAQDEKKAG